MKEKSHTLTGEEKKTYLHQLIKALSNLEDGLKAEIPEKRLESIMHFGESEGWDWSRLPKASLTYQKLARITREAKNFFTWFDWQTGEEPEQNKGYFKEIGVSTESGLPWIFDVIELRRLKQNAHSILQTMPSYDDISSAIIETLTKDYKEITEVRGEVATLHETAMRRNFLELLQKESFFDEKLGEYTLFCEASKILRAGAEELWNITVANYIPGSCMLDGITIDIWQDDRERVLKEEEGEVEVVPELKNSLNFGKDNAAWYIISSIDKKFISLHPVHVTRVLIGPFENKYLTGPDEIKALDISQEIIREDPNFSLLRFSRQYSYAPNHEIIGGEQKQVVYQENWHDELIVCPAKYSARVSGSVLGTKVRVLEM